jgi:predicted ester cyclase
LQTFFAIVCNGASEGLLSGRAEMRTDHLEDKRRLHVGLARLAEAGPGGAGTALAALYAPDAEWRGAHPLNEMHGVEAIATRVWEPLLAACPDLERRDLIVAGSAYDGRDYVAMVGHYCGTFRSDWLGIPATGRAIYLRYGEVHQVSGGRIVQSSCLWDILDLIRQAGLWPLAPSLGVQAMWPGPITGDGLLLDRTDPAQSAASLAQILMPQRAHWHPRMMWYGPSGIGTTRGLAGFVDHHQLPFRTAFPNRKGGQHYIRIGDGPISVTGGWPSVTATHTGGGFLGLGPTGRQVGMRVMDFYLHHEGLIRENWVPLDILDLLMQLGVDVLARMRAQLGR